MTRILVIESVDVGTQCFRDTDQGRVCTGIIELRETRGHGCSCHTGHAPCSYCTQQNEFCPECGWEAEDA